MVEVNCETKIKIDMTIEDAIEAIYQDCINNGRKEDDKTDERSEGIFKSIECLRKNFVYVTNSTKANDLNKIYLDGVLSSRAYQSSCYPVISADSVDILNALISRLRSTSENITINGVRTKYYDPYLKSPNSDYFQKAKELIESINYLSKNYYYYIKGISIEEQRKIEYRNEVRKRNEALQYKRESTCDSDIYYNAKNGKSDIAYYWKFLGIPIGSDLKTIKVAYIYKYDLIEKSLANGKKEFTSKDLVTLNNSLSNLISAYLRYVLYCKDGNVKPDSEAKYNEISKQCNIASEIDFDIKGNKKLLSWVLFKINEYNRNKKSVCNKVDIDEKTLSELIESFEPIIEELSKKISEQGAVKHSLKKQRK